MIKDILEDFEKKYEVNEEIIEKYKDSLPEELIKMWREYGFGTFKNGYFKVISPDDYKEILEKSYFKGDVSVPVFATAFGDLILWDNSEYVSIVKYRYGDFDVIIKGFSYFDETITDNELAEEFYSFDKYENAVKKYGKLEYDECFGYVPLLALGGKESVNSLKKVKIKEHIALITEMVGEI